MSGAMFPNYNSGKVIGEINWLLEKSGVTNDYVSTGIKEEIAEVIVPINRKDLNEFVFGYARATSSTANLVLKYSSETQNDMFDNIVYFLRNSSIGDPIYIKDRGSGSFSTYFSIEIISETEKEFILKIYAFGTTSSSNYNCYYKIAVGYR